MSERVVKCPVCYNEDKCFEEVQKTFSSFLCFHCGYSSHSDYKKDWEGLESVLANSALIIKELKFFDDERGIFWFPSVVNMGAKGIIFPEGNVEMWHWKYAKVIKIAKKQQKNFPIADKKGKYYESRLDVENAKQYGQYNFLDACKEMGIVMNIK